MDFLGTLGVIAAVFAIPGVLSWYLGKRLRMEDYSWKLFVIFFAVSASTMIIVFGEARLGIDLRGGVNLVYGVERVEREDQSLPTLGNLEDRMVGPVRKRIDPSGLQEITIRPFGANQLEIIMPAADQADAESVMDKLQNTGSMSFQIVATKRKNNELIQQAREARQRGIRNIRDEDTGRIIAEWVPLYEGEDGEPVRLPSNPIYEVDESLWEEETEERTIREVLLLVPESGFEVTGKYLTRSWPGVGEGGNPIVQFAFNAEGAARFGQLTGEYAPKEGFGEFRYLLAIVLDGEVFSAPTINSRIGGQGQISGDFTQQEVQDLVDVLNAGGMPARLSKFPIKLEVTGPLLGADVIFRGSVAIAIAMGLVLAFMIWYYRWAGLLATMALVLNLLFVVAMMYAVNAVFTLPGLAGLILTVGMSIDANVLIYERLREELDRGATLRMALRNGYQRATTTIVDANLTTIIVATVLYVIGTDQIKGFAVTLWLGVALSMFTAIFCTRVAFDILERKRVITHLHMMRMFSRTNFDFLGGRRLAYAVSATVIGIGLVATAARAENLLDIDFLGGTSVRLQFEQAKQRGEVEQRVRSIQIRVTEDGQPVVLKGDSAADGVQAFTSVDVKVVGDFEKSGVLGIFSPTSPTFVVDALLSPSAKTQLGVIPSQDDKESEGTQQQKTLVRLVEDILAQEFGPELTRNKVERITLQESSQDKPSDGAAEQPEPPPPSDPTEIPQQPTQSPKPENTDQTPSSPSSEPTSQPTPAEKPPQPGPTIPAPTGPNGNKPQTPETDSAKPTTVKPAGLQEESPQPKTNQPQTSKPATSESGTSESGTSEPATSESGTSESGTSESGTSEPATSESGTSESGPKKSKLSPEQPEQPETAGEEQLLFHPLQSHRWALHPRVLFFGALMQEGSADGDAPPPQASPSSSASNEDTPEAGSTTESIPTGPMSLTPGEDTPAALPEQSSPPSTQPSSPKPETPEPETPDSEASQAEPEATGDVEATLEFAVAIDGDDLRVLLRKHYAQVSENPVQDRTVAILRNQDANKEDDQAGKKWNVTLLKVNPAQAQDILERVQAEVQTIPYFPYSNEIGGQVATSSQRTALQALLVSLLFIVAYIWFRFHRISYGLAAVAALVHDVTVMLGALALSYYLAPALGIVGVEAFKINLSVVAAFLTIIGYSLNDTIVVFDRVREVKGKAPDLTIEMLNTALNQTLSRTLLTALTTLLVVVILYAASIATLKAFAFSLIIGVIVGTYSSIYIACSALIWLGEVKIAPSTGSTNKSDSTTPVKASA